MCCGTKANEMDKGKLEKAVKFITFIKKGGGVGSEFCPNQKFFINCDTRGVRNLCKITSRSFLYNLQIPLEIF